MFALRTHSKSGYPCFNPAIIVPQWQSPAPVVSIAVTLFSHGIRRFSFNALSKQNAPFLPSVIITELSVMADRISAAFSTLSAFVKEMASSSFK